MSSYRQPWKSDFLLHSKLPDEQRKQLESCVVRETFVELLDSEPAEMRIDFVRLDRPTGFPPTGKVKTVELLFFDMKKFGATLAELTGIGAAAHVAPLTLILSLYRALKIVHEASTVPLASPEACLTYFWAKASETDEEAAYREYEEFARVNGFPQIALADFGTINNRLKQLGILDIRDGHIRLADKIMLSDSSAR